MTDWITVHDGRTEEPPTIDTTSSATTVYERRNIRQETWQEQFGAGEAVEVTEWVYEQREYTTAEYESLTSPATKAIMQAMSEMELAIAYSQGYREGVNAV